MAALFGHNRAQGNTHARTHMNTQTHTHEPFSPLSALFFPAALNKASASHFFLTPPAFFFLFRTPALAHSHARSRSSAHTPFCHFFVCLVSTLTMKGSLFFLSILIESGAAGSGGSEGRGLVAVTPLAAGQRV